MMNQDENIKRFYEAKCKGNALPRNKKVEKSFTDHWGFPNEVRLKYDKFAKYEICPLDEKFKSGRTKYIVSFLDKDGNIYGLHIGMELISKKSGKPYFMCELQPMTSTNFENASDDASDTSDGYP